MKAHESLPEAAQFRPAAAEVASRRATPSFGSASTGAAALQARIDQSPRMLAQRKALESNFGGAYQRQTEPLADQMPTGGMAPSVAQRLGEAADTPEPAAAPPVSQGGMPYQLQVGIEALSGMSMADVRVHRNSDKPAQLNALAYTQGNDIHLGPGQDRHLAHEAWHVAQQRQGRVRPTLQAHGALINDDPALEQEADVMGQRALSTNGVAPAQRVSAAAGSAGQPIQRLIGFEFETGWVLKAPANAIGMHTKVIEGLRWSVVPDRLEYTAEELDGMGIGPGRAHVGSGALEFVTEAFDEGDIGPGGRLESALLQIEQVGNALNSASRGIFGTAIDTPINQVVGKNGIGWGQNLQVPPPQPGGQLGDAAHRLAIERVYAKRDNILVRRIGALASAPQMTGGIKLEQLIHLLDRMSQPQGGPALGGQTHPGSALMENSQAREITILATCVARARLMGQARVADGSVAGGNQAAYEGAMAELGSYVQLASAYGNNIAYDKGIAPLLARTDFGQLPGWLRGVPGFIEDVLFTSNRWPGALNSAALVGAGNTKLFVKVGLHDAVTSRGWLNSIQGGRDPLTWGQDRTKASWNPQQVGQAGNQALGHVYEFRRMVNPLPFNQWRTYAMGMADLVVRANQGNLQ